MDRCRCTAFTSRFDIKQNQKKVIDEIKMIINETSRPIMLQKKLRLSALFSSPEHNVPMVMTVSYWNGPVSGVNNFFKHPLLNHLANSSKLYRNDP